MVCTGEVPAQTDDGKDWEAALAPFANATAASAQFDNIGFAAPSFQRMLDIVFGIGSSNKTGGVQVALTNCSMRGVDVEAAAIAAAGGSTQYMITLTDSVFNFNQLNATGAFASQVNLNLALQLLGTGEWAAWLQRQSACGWLCLLTLDACLTPQAAPPPDHPACPCPSSLPAEIRGNTLMLAGAAAVGATGTASISLAQGSSVVNNKAMLIGALAVGGDASLTVQLSASNVTGNEPTAMGGIAVGGQGSASVTGQNGTDVVVKRNSVDWQAAVITEQPLVKTVVEGIMGLGGCLPACW